MFAIKSVGLGGKRWKARSRIQIVGYYSEDLVARAVEIDTSCQCQCGDDKTARDPDLWQLLGAWTFCGEGFWIEGG